MSPDKSTAAVKQVKAEVAKLWLEVKAPAVQNLLCCQNAVIQGFVSSAADRRSTCKVTCNDTQQISLTFTLIDMLLMAGISHDCLQGVLFMPNTTHAAVHVV